MRIAFENVGLVKGGKRILEDVSFSTEGAGIFLVFGESGSGKTSLLRLINRLDEADRGRILVDSAPVTSLPPTDLRRRVGMIFQEPRLLEGTVGENVLFAARYHDVEVELEHLLDQVGLAGLGERNVADLSGGEQQRTAIARALALRPPVLLMDEPTSSLDRRAALAIERLLQELADAHRLLVLFVTHSLGQLRRLGAKGIVLAGGRIVHQGDILPYLEKQDV